MLVLGLDTSSEIGAAGLINEQGILGEINLHLIHKHSERTLSNLDYLFKESGHSIKELDGIGVTVGPGSFTGIRIGLSTVKSFAQVLEIPVIGLSALDVLAYNLIGANDWIVPVIDARRERVYTALYQGWSEDIKKQKLWEDQALKIDDLIAKLTELNDKKRIYLIGNGADVYRTKFMEASIEIEFFPTINSIPRGGSIAELSYYYLKKGNSVNYLELLPSYLKKPQAEINWQKKYGGAE